MSFNGVKRHRRRTPPCGAILCACCVLVCALTTLSCQALPVGVNIDPSNPAGGNPTVAAVASTGATWVRLEYKASSAHDNGANNISMATLRSYQSVVSAYNAAGISVLVILDYDTVIGAPWGGTATQWSTYTDTFVNQAHSIATSLSTMQGGFEVWNEEDLQQTYVPPASYGALLHRVFKVIKSVSRSLLVVMGGLASGNPGYISNVLNATGGVLYADQVGLHPYGQRPFPNWPNPTWGFGYLGSLIASYDAVSQSKPIMITEVGTSDMTAQGSFPWMIFDSISASMPSVSVCIWFCWSDGMVAPFGLLDVDGGAKPDYHSFVNFTRPN